MVTEDYVSFETAKLLKEKRFNEQCETSYYISNVGCENVVSIGDFTRIRPYRDDLIAAPTLQTAMKWLRNQHNIHIDVFIGINPDDTFTYWSYFITNLKGNMIYNAYGEDGNFIGKTYEETVEAALKHCLIHLI